jgi:hypothetical protein
LVVKLDLSQAPSTLKSIIIHQSRLAEQVHPDANQSGIVIVRDEDDSEDGINDVKRRIKDILIQFKIRDFVAITDPVDKQKILIVGRKDAEKLDSFHCHHCGMEFVDEIQLGIHQRLHLPF